MKERATAIIAEKDAEIERLNRELDRVEKMVDSGLQAGVDEDMELKSKLAKTEIAIKNMDFRAETEIQTLKEQYAEEIKELEAKHKKEMTRLYKELDRATKNQSGLRKQQDKAAKMRASVTKDEITEKQLQDAREQAKQGDNEVARLESELKKLKQKQQKQIVDQARMVKEREERRKAQEAEKRKARKASNKQEVEALNSELKKEENALEEKIQRLIERNNQLDKDLAAALAENAQKTTSKKSFSATTSSRTKRAKSARRKTPKSRQVSSLTEFSVVEAEIIRLRDENEELRQIVKRLDKLAYVSGPYWAKLNYGLMEDNIASKTERNRA